MNGLIKFNFDWMFNVPCFRWNDRPRTDPTVEYQFQGKWQRETADEAVLCRASEENLSHFNKENRFIRHCLWGGKTVLYSGVIIQEWKWTRTKSLSKRMKKKVVKNMLSSNTGRRLTRSYGRSLIGTRSTKNCIPPQIDTRCNYWNLTEENCKDSQHWSHVLKSRASVPGNAPLNCLFSDCTINP